MISIALATYNGGKYLNEQIDSILCQTIQDFEIIISDDNSTDNTIDIIKQKQLLDKRIKLYVNSSNIGFKENFERAISLCSGDYIALCDQDDIWNSNHLEILINNIDSNSLACGNAELIDANGISLNKVLSDVDRLFAYNRENILYKILLDNNCFQGASMLLEKKFVKNVLPIPKVIPFHDVWFACCAAMENGIDYTFDTITKYRQHGKNITFSNHNKQSFFKKVLKRIKFFLGGIESDRFLYLDELEKKYGQDNLNIKKLREIILSTKINLSFSKLIFIYKNYEKITTESNHKYFIKNIIRWKLWRK